MTEGHTPDLIERLRSHFDDCPPRQSDRSFTRPLLTEAADELTTLRDALARIAEDLGHCATCGTPASGIVECDCAKPEWVPDDYKAVARAALEAIGLPV